MKRSKVTALFTSLLFTLSLSAQTVFTANNNAGAPGGVNVFTGATALTDAVTAASAGDIIHVVRSAVSYGDITVDKQLTIYGVGLNPDTDGSDRSLVDLLTISDPLATGTRISGLHITNQLALGGVAGALNNLLIENNNVRWIQHAAATTTLGNVILKNNVIGSGFTTSEEKIDLLAGAIANIIISNNVIYSPMLGFRGTVKASNGTVVENNLFVGANGGSASFAFEDFDGNSVKNNIFYGVRPSGTSSFTNNTFENNISFNSGYDVFSTTNGNTSTNDIEAQDPLFVNVPHGGTIDFANFDPTLMGGSPASGTGEGGTDMGVFGGLSPMNIEGTLIPTIQSLTLPTSVVKGDNLQVQIKAKGN